MNVAIVGATGLVGSTFLKVLEEKDYIKIENLYLYASQKSEGKIIFFKNKPHKVIVLKEENIIDKKIDFALFSAGSEVSKKFAPIFKNSGAIVIDNSSAFRMEKYVPLVVPEVNAEKILNKKIIANPNCSTIQCMAPLKALDKKFNLTKVIFSTYQAVSGSGHKGLNDLDNNKNGRKSQFYPYQIYDNLIPHIDSFLNNGYTKEEMKMVNETRKILNKKSLKISSTCVRVPISFCHAVSIWAEFKKEVDLQKAISSFKQFKNIKILNDSNSNSYPMPILAKGTDNIFVGRIRKDLFNKKAINFFVVADNIRKGAASNAVEIMEYILNHKNK